MHASKDSLRGKTGRCCGDMPPCSIRANHANDSPPNHGPKRSELRLNGRGSYPDV